MSRRLSGDAVQARVLVVEDNGVTPSRALGQNFVADANTVRRIARLAERRARRPGASR